MDKRIKSIGEVMGLLGEQMEQLRPCNRPTKESILAAKEFSKVVDSYLAAIATCLQYCEMMDQEPDLDFMKTDIVKPIGNKKGEA